MNPPRWTDDELLRELGAALREEEEVDEGVIRAAQAAFTWRTVDAELEVLGLAAGTGLAAAGQVRDGGPGQRRMLSFHGERVSVDVEIDGAGLVGQLSPPRPGRVTLLTADGPQATAPTDEVGCFTLPPPPPGPMRLDCVLGDLRFLTEWTTI